MSIPFSLHADSSLVLGVPTFRVSNDGRLATSNDPAHIPAQIGIAVILFRKNGKACRYQVFHESSWDIPTCEGSATGTVKYGMVRWNEVDKKFPIVETKDMNDADTIESTDKVKDHKSFVIDDDVPVGSEGPALQVIFVPRGYNIRVIHPDDKYEAVVVPFFDFSAVYTTPNESRDYKTGRVGRQYIPDGVGCTEVCPSILNRVLRRSGHEDEPSPNPSYRIAKDHTKMVRYSLRDNAEVTPGKGANLGNPSTWTCTFAKHPTTVVSMDRVVTDILYLLPSLNTSKQVVENLLNTISATVPTPGPTRTTRKIMNVEYVIARDASRIALYGMRLCAEPYYDGWAYAPMYRERKISKKGETDTEHEMIVVNIRSIPVPVLASIENEEEKGAAHEVVRTEPEKGQEKEKTGANTGPVEKEHTMETVEKKLLEDLDYQVRFDKNNQIVEVHNAKDVAKKEKKKKEEGAEESKGTGIRTLLFRMKPQGEGFVFCDGKGVSIEEKKRESKTSRDERHIRQKEHVEECLTKGANELVKYSLEEASKAVFWDMGIDLCLVNKRKPIAKPVEWVSRVFGYIRDNSRKQEGEDEAAARSRPSSPALAPAPAPAPVSAKKRQRIAEEEKEKDGDAPSSKRPRKPGVDLSWGRVKKDNPFLKQEERIAELQKELDMLRKSVRNSHAEYMEAMRDPAKKKRAEGTKKSHSSSMEEEEEEEEEEEGDELTKAYKNRTDIMNVEDGLVDTLKNIVGESSFKEGEYALAEKLARTRGQIPKKEAESLLYRCLKMVVEDEKNRLSKVPMKDVLGTAYNNLRVYVGTRKEKGEEVHKWVNLVPPGDSAAKKASIRAFPESTFEFGKMKATVEIKRKEGKKRAAKATIQVTTDGEKLTINVPAVSRLGDSYAFLFGKSFYVYTGPMAFKSPSIPWNKDVKRQEAVTKDAAFIKVVLNELIPRMLKDRKAFEKEGIEFKKETEEDSILGDILADD